MWALHDSTTAAEKAQAEYNTLKEQVPNTAAIVATHQLIMVS